MGSNLSESECMVIVCKITQSLCKKNEIPLPKEVSDFIQKNINSPEKESVKV